MNTDAELAVDAVEESDWRRAGYELYLREDSAEDAVYDLKILEPPNDRRLDDQTGH